MSKTSPLHISTVIPSRPEALIKVAEEIRKEDPNLQLICNAIKEDVDPLADGGGHGHDAVRPGDPVEAADEVGQVVQHGEVVLHDNNVVVRTDQVPDGFGRV